MGSGPRVLSLCAGIGGLDLGIELAFPGARTVCLVEREAACIELLATRMEEGRLAPAPVWTDLRTFDGTAWRGRVDLVAAGYPCQPFSFAGKGLAEKDPRHLWPDVARIIGEVQPTLVVLENVQGHVKRGLDQVLLDLHELGFDAEWGVYSASQAGAPHRRNRVFVLAYSRSGGLPLGWTAHHHNGSDAPRNDIDGCLSGVENADLSGKPCGVQQSGRTTPRGASKELAYASRAATQRRGERGVLPGPTEAMGGHLPQQHTADYCGEGMAYAPRERCNAWGAEPEGLQGPTDAAQCGEQVADAASDHRGGGKRTEEAGTRQEQERGQRPSGRGGELAHSNHGGCSLEQRPRSSEEENRRGEEDLVASGRGPELADSRSERPQGHREGGAAAGAARRSSGAEVPDEPLPPWPPGPEGDWSDIPEYLWPATQPPLRRMADGVPVRVDQLRALGNAVVPQQAALALRDLMGRLR